MPLHCTDRARRRSGAARSLDPLRALLAGSALALAPLALVACEEATDDGTFEEAGENVDDALGDAADSAEDALDEAGDAVEEAGDELEEAGEDAASGGGG